MSEIYNGAAPAQPGHETYRPAFGRRRTDPGVACTAPAHHRVSRILLINAAPRCDGSWCGPAALTWRLVELARSALQADGIETEVLDTDSVKDAAHSHWAGAHGVIVVTPADTGAAQAMLEQVFPSGSVLDGAYGIIVHGEPADADVTRTRLAAWFDGTGLVDSDSFGPLTAHAGYRACVEDGMDRTRDDEAVASELTGDVARAVLKAVADLRAGRLAGVPAARAS